MKQLLTITLTMILCCTAKSQTAADSVKTAVNKMFAAMKNADSTALKGVFSESAVLQTISRNKEGATVVRTEAIANFATSIGKLVKGDADEQITFGAVHVDGALASVWTPYKFYFKGNFSHCGVNSFQLVRLNGEWKIQYIIDTRRKDNCN